MTILKGVPSCISPELLGVLASMGHGDRLVLADANFPSVKLAKTTTHGRVVDASGQGVCDLLAAILQLLPLDSYETPAYVMQPVPSDAQLPVPIWADYGRLIRDSEQRPVQLSEVERFAFYTQASQAFAIVATSERALYANLMLVKGVLAAP